MDSVRQSDRPTGGSVVVYSWLMMKRRLAKARSRFPLNDRQADTSIGKTTLDPIVF